MTDMHGILLPVLITASIVIDRRHASLVLPEGHGYCRLLLYEYASSRTLLTLIASPRNDALKDNDSNSNNFRELLGLSSS